MPQLVGEPKAKWRPSYAPQNGRTAYVSQERSPIEGRISVGILEPRDRPVSVLLQVPFLIQYPGRPGAADPHPHANKPEIPLSLLKEEPFIGFCILITAIGS